MNQQPQFKVDMSLAKTIACEACGNETFVEVLYIKKLSKLVTGAPNDALIPVPSFACAKCHNVNQEFRDESSSSKSIQE